MTPRPSRGRLSGTAIVAAVGLAAAFGTAAQMASAPLSAPPVPSSSTPAAASTSNAAKALPADSAGREEGTRWSSLAPGQRRALGPLEHDWPTMDAASKQKWLTIADRFPTLAPQERSRISERMTEWSRLSPGERGEARIRFQEARQVPAPDRSARWEAYQKLPPDEKQRLLAKANAAASSASGARRSSQLRDSQAKVNLVPNPALAQPPRAVSPTMVQASPGATTRLITKPTTPPAHQQTGMPKIAATPEFVNRSTLLPRRGPQAAVSTPSTSAPAAATTTTHPAPLRPPTMPMSVPTASNPAR